MGAASALAIMAAETPLVGPLARIAEERNRGLVRRLPLPEWGRDVAGLLLMDYTFYLWHVLTHKVPLLWRLHLVHHVDLDLDASTALRFHALDMVVSAPWRAGQVALIGLSLGACACGSASSSSRSSSTTRTSACRKALRGAWPGS